MPAPRTLELPVDTELICVRCTVEANAHERTDDASRAPRRRKARVQVDRGWTDRNGRRWWNWQPYCRPHLQQLVTGAGSLPPFPAGSGHAPQLEVPA